MATGAAASVPAVWRTLRSEPSAILLFVQLGGVLLYPFRGGGSRGRALFSLFGIVVLALGVRGVRTPPALTGVSVVLGGPATVLLLIQAVTDEDALQPYSSALEAVLYF